MGDLDIKCRKCGKRFYYVTDAGIFKCRSCGYRDNIKEMSKEIEENKIKEKTLRGKEGKKKKEEGDI